MNLRFFGLDLDSRRIPKLHGPSLRVRCSASILERKHLRPQAQSEMFASCIPDSGPLAPELGCLVIVKQGATLGLGSNMKKTDRRWTGTPEQRISRFLAQQ